MIAAWRVMNWLVYVLLFSTALNAGGTYFHALTSIGRNPSDEFIWESVSYPDSLDPHIDYESYGAWILYNIYETLYTYPWNSSRVEPLVPLLAAEMPSISPDGVNYTIRLRQGVMFQDGTSFNASSVKWNIESHEDLISQRPSFDAGRGVERWSGC